MAATDEPKIEIKSHFAVNRAKIKACKCKQQTYQRVCHIVVMKIQSGGYAYHIKTEQLEYQQIASKHIYIVFVTDKFHKKQTGERNLFAICLFSII